ncbi:AtpZ/AtpI family protein [Pseudooceanicola spongiae]|jgi:ATP synthase protein I|uniref:ATP synthase protein I n=1 Tax=Pseudooceanicola spongiae TaxID=2613965 RepID=A0A7L9WQC8_9RHOB|nr:AtpZ/AtpI family protein [Pseudooceanicola spongiae]QOL81636.1 F0F1 ATP synthase subunit I [Pseudooceanicola spongiae]
MNDPDHRDRMAALEARIAAAKGIDKKSVPHGQDHYSAAQVGWRMVTELVAGLLIGFAIGYGLDWLLGIAPAMMILFTLLGFVAGIKAMIRSAKELENDTSGHSAGDELRDKDGD